MKLFELICINFEKIVLIFSNGDKTLHFVVWTTEVKKWIECLHMYIVQQQYTVLYVQCTLQYSEYVQTKIKQKCICRGGALLENIFLHFYSKDTKKILKMFICPFWSRIGILLFNIFYCKYISKFFLKLTKTKSDAGTL